MNYSYRKFKKEDFNEIFQIFLKFQEKNQIETFSNITKNYSRNLSEIYLKEEFKKILKKSSTYLSICDSQIFGFACFSESFYRQDAIDLQIACKSPHKTFSFEMKRLLVEVFQEAKKEFNKNVVLCALGPRYKFDSYKNFVVRVFKPKILKKNYLKKTIIMFND